MSKHSGIKSDIPYGELEALCEAYKDGRVVVLPCKVGDTYTGICREIVPAKKKKVWETKAWLDSGVVIGFKVTAELTAEKAGYNHKRDIEEIGKAWFIGERAREEAEAKLKEITHE